MQNTTAYSRGDVVLVDFVFAEETGSKRRPVLLLSSEQYMQGRQEVVGFVLGRQLRHEYGLGRGRGHESAPFDNDQEIPAGIDGYPEVEAHLDLEEMLKGAPPRQREAIEIYLESVRTGRTVEELALERGLKPVTVRNNIKAFRKKYLR